MQRKETRVPADENANYEFTLTDKGESKNISGKELLEGGYEITLDEKYSSEIIKYRRI